MHNKDPTIFTRSKNAFQFSSDLSCTCALFESTDKSNDERTVKAEARKTKMKQRKRTSGGSDNDGTAKNKLYEGEREREEINAVRGIRDNRKRIQAWTIVCSTLSSQTHADKTGLNHKSDYVTHPSESQTLSCACKTGVHRHIWTTGWSNETKSNLGVRVVRVCVCVWEAKRQQATSRVGEGAFHQSESGISRKY